MDNGVGPEGDYEKQFDLMAQEKLLWVVTDEVKAGMCDKKKIPTLLEAKEIADKYV